MYNFSRCTLRVFPASTGLYVWEISPGLVLNPPWLQQHSAVVCNIHDSLLTAPRWAPGSPPSPSMCLIPLHISSYLHLVMRDFLRKKKAHRTVDVNTKDIERKISVQTGFCRKQHITSEEQKDFSKAVLQL